MTEAGAGPSSLLALQAEVERLQREARAAQQTSEELR